MDEGRNKTLTALASTEPLAETQRKNAEKLQWFLTKVSYDPEVVNQRRVELMLEDPQTAQTLDDAGISLMVGNAITTLNGLAKAAVYGDEGTSTVVRVYKSLFWPGSTANW